MIFVFISVKLISVKLITYYLLAITYYLLLITYYFSITTSSTERRMSCHVLE